MPLVIRWFYRVTFGIAVFVGVTSAIGCVVAIVTGEWADVPGPLILSIAVGFMLVVRFHRGASGQTAAGPDGPTTVRVGAGPDGVASLRSRSPSSSWRRTALFAFTFVFIGAPVWTYYRPGPQLARDQAALDANGCQCSLIDALSGSPAI